MVCGARTCWYMTQSLYTTTANVQLRAEHVWSCIKFRGQNLIWLQMSKKKFREIFGKWSNAEIFSRKLEFLRNSWKFTENRRFDPGKEKKKAEKGKKILAWTAGKVKISLPCMALRDWWKKNNIMRFPYKNSSQPARLNIGGVESNNPFFYKSFPWALPKK